MIFIGAIFVVSFLVTAYTGYKAWVQPEQYLTRLAAKKRRSLGEVEQGCYLTGARTLPFIMGLFLLLILMGVIKVNY
jgi:hypothetical protein